MTEFQLAYNLLRSALDGGTLHVGYAPIDVSRWWNLFRLMQRNHVAALTAEAAASSGMPREVLIPWLTEKEKAVDWHRHQTGVQEEIVDVMRRHGIETLVLKGTHTAQYYLQPETREFGDVDLYFFDRHREADSIARKVLKVEVTNEAHHHSRFDYHGVTVESHYDFVNRHYPSSNRYYEKLLKELSSSRSTLATFEVLFLLRHMAGHFAASRNTMRDLVDWTLTCRALQGEVDWQWVQQTVDDYGMRTYVTILNIIAEKQLGIALPLQRDNGPDILANTDLVEHDLVYGSVTDHAADGLGRLTWKMRRWFACRWKRRLVYSDSELSLLLASLTSHLGKPRSILHKV